MNEPLPRFQRSIIGSKSTCPHCRQLAFDCIFHCASKSIQFASGRLHTILGALQSILYLQHRPFTQQHRAEPEAKPARQPDGQSCTCYPTRHKQSSHLIRPPDSSILLALVTAYARQAKLGPTPPLAKPSTDRRASHWINSSSWERHRKLVFSDYPAQHSLRTRNRETKRRIRSHQLVL